MKYENVILSSKKSKDIKVILDSDERNLNSSYSKLYAQFDNKNSFYSYIKTNFKFINIDGISFIKKEYGVNNIRKYQEKSVVEIWEYHTSSLELSNLINKSLNKNTSTHTSPTSVQKALLLECSDYVIVDTQTTGIDTVKNKIISIGMVHVSNNQVVSKELFFVDPMLTKQEILEYTTPQDFSGKSPYSISRINVPGMDGQTQTFITEREIIKKLVSALKNKYVVGHNLNFEMKMINALFVRNNVKEHMSLEKIIKQQICTLHILKEKYNHRDNSLDGWIKRLNLKTYNRLEYHDPLKDSEILFTVINTINNTIKK
jgi:DNA polymerase III epsilon subunit-like protein